MIVKCKLKKQSKSLHFSSLFLACVILTLYGAAIVFIELIAEFMFSLTNNSMTMCIWMMIVVGVLTPITWLGAPKDFW